jgi:ATP-dependent protease ClpP protease subunit
MEDSERDYYMNPEESLKYGLIDKIASQPQKNALAALSKVEV